MPKEPEAVIEAPPDPAKEIELRYFLAEADQHIPMLDLHGKTREETLFEIEQFISFHKDEDAVRIIYGHGKGILGNAVRQYLNGLSRQQKNPVLGFRVEKAAASCVILMKK